MIVNALKMPTICTVRILQLKQRQISMQHFVQVWQVQPKNDRKGSIWGKLSLLLSFFKVSVGSAGFGGSFSALQPGIS